MSTLLPTLTGVSESTIKQFLLAVAGNVSVDDNNELPTIVDTKGRCVRVRVSGLPFTWHEKAELLLGTCKPVEEFRVDGNYITARLKRAEQIAADALAFDADQLTGELEAFWPFFVEEPAPMRTAAELNRAATKQKRKREIPEGVAQTVMRTMEKEFPVGQVDTEELIAKTKAVMPKDLDARGDDRRRKYIKQAIAKLVEREFLFIHGDDQDQISLTAIKEISDAE